jgi:hypothetical protein
LAIVPDTTAPAPFAYAFENVGPPFNAVIHTTSPFVFGTVSSSMKFPDPAAKGKTEILKATEAPAPELKRVATASSLAAVGAYSLPPDPRESVDGRGLESEGVERCSERRCSGRVLWE